MVKDKHGMKHSQINEVLSCWEDRFKTHLKITFQHDQVALNEIPLTQQPSGHGRPRDVPGTSKSCPLVSVQNGHPGDVQFWHS